VEERDVFCNNKRNLVGKRTCGSWRDLDSDIVVRNNFVNEFFTSQLFVTFAISWRSGDRLLYYIFVDLCFNKLFK